ncbi:MAG: hypothetical protein ACKOQ6_11090 [Bacteroidota bacterium]
MKLLLFLLTMIVSSSVMAQDQQRKVVDFTGGARSVITNNGLTVRDTVADTTTVGHTTNGYALVDLGVDIRPNDKTELMGMFRIRSGYGGFWGAGVTFDVRQLWLKGIIGNIVRYQVGDLNLKQTPFSLYNHHADRFDSLPDVFTLQSDIVNYERFYTDNTWRQQGVNVDFGLEFAKGIKGIDFSGYVTRMNATDFLSVPDRLMAGFSAVVVQQEDLKIGYHQSSIFNVKGTAAQDVSFNNTVNSISTVFKTDIKGIQVSVESEGGQSRYSDGDFADRPALEDYFLHARINATTSDRKLGVHAGYLNVGPDFRSLGAQSKDIDYNALPQNFDRYTNGQIVRPLDLTDMIGDFNLYVTSVTDKLMDFNPAVNNILPYGIATFNRLGIFAGAVYRPLKSLQLDATLHSLREIRGQGTLTLKNFTRTNMNARVQVGELLKWKKKLMAHAGFSLQSTERKGSVSVEDVSLNSTRLQGGIEIEVSKGLDVLGGIISLDSDGSDFTALRDDYTQIDFFDRTDFNIKQTTYAAGLRYRFQNNIYLCGLYQSSSYENRSGDTLGFTVNQFAIIYNMTF